MVRKVGVLLTFIIFQEVKVKNFVKNIQKNKFLKIFFKFYKSAETDLTSIAVAYYFLISIFPLLLIVANILPYFHIQSDELLTILNQVLPDSLYQTLSKIVSDILNRPSTGFLSFSILSALWTFSQSISFLQKAFNKSYGVSKGRGLIWSRVVGFLVSLGLQFLLGFSLLLTIFGRMIVNFLYTSWKFNSHFYHQLLNMTEPTVYIMLFLSLTMLYFFLPNIKIPKFRYVLPGTIFVVLIIFSLSHLFGVYIDKYMYHFLDTRFISSIVVIVIMFWFILISKVLIIGSILNASMQAYFEGKFETRNGELISFVEKDIIEKNVNHC